MPYEWELPAFCDIYINTIGNIHLKSSLIKRSLLFPYYKGNAINMAMTCTLHDTGLTYRGTHLHCMTDRCSRSCGNQYRVSYIFTQ